MKVNIKALAVALLTSGAIAQYDQFDAREATIDSVHHDLRSGLTTCRDVVSAFIARIEKLNENVNALISLNPTALETADALDKQLEAGNMTGALFCIPMVLKDNYNTKDVLTTGGCLDLAKSQPSEDAPTVTQLREAGAIVLGKANLHELALEGLSVSSLGGQSINAYDFTRTPGGSSGGTGAAVAASLAVLGTGTDTVNSLRSPASAGSLFSIRPTRGLLSRAGTMPISFIQDSVGPIARSIRDVAITLTVMAARGFDPNDNTTALIPPENIGLDYNSSLGDTSLKGLRLGLVNGFFNHAASNETTPVNDAMAAVVERLQAAGAVIVPINDTIYNSTAISATYDTQRFEYRQTMDAYLQRPTLEGSHPDTLNELYNSSKFLVIPSQYAFVKTALVSSTSNETFPAVLAAIEELKAHLQGTFESNDLDAFIYPEQSNLVVKIGSAAQAGRNGVLAAVTGVPVVTVPVGFSQATSDAPIGVPIGMEILGRPWAERKLLGIGFAIEQMVRVRKTPVFAREVVEFGHYDAVPTITPNTANIPSVYPLGTLGQNKKNVVEFT